MSSIQPETTETISLPTSQTRLRTLAIRFLVSLAVVTTLFALAWSR